MPKIVHFGEFLKTEACGQTMFPDSSIFIGQKLVENAKILNGITSKMSFLVNKIATLFGHFSTIKSLSRIV